MKHTPVASPSHRATGRLRAAASAADACRNAPGRAGSAGPSAPQRSRPAPVGASPGPPATPPRTGPLVFAKYEHPWASVWPATAPEYRSCPTKRRITEPFFRSIHACSFLRYARERVNSMPCRSQYVTGVSSMNTLSLSESIPLTGTGNTCATASSPSPTGDRSRAGSGTASVRPEQTSVTTRLWMNAPEATPPPWSTRSISR